MGLLDRKCRFWKKCKQYNPQDTTCEKNSGIYYMDGFEGRGGGCYRDMAEQERKEKEKRKMKSISDLQPFTKYLLVGIAVTILSIFFSWLFIDIIGIKALYTSSVLTVITFLFKYHSYTKINLIKEKFIIFLVIEISSLILYVIAATVLIDILYFPTLFIIPMIIGTLFLLRFVALHWTKIIKK